MEQYDTNGKILEVIKEFVVCDFNNNSKLKELGISSLEYIELVVKLEKIFNIEFEECTLMIDYFKTISDLVNYVCSKSN